MVSGSLGYAATCRRSVGRAEVAPDSRRLPICCWPLELALTAVRDAETPNVKGTPNAKEDAYRKRKRMPLCPLMTTQLMDEATDYVSTGDLPSDLVRALVAEPYKR